MHLLLSALLLGCPASDPVPVPVPVPVPDSEPVASIPLGYLDPAPAGTGTGPSPLSGPKVIPRDPWAAPTSFHNHPDRCKEFGAIAPSPSEDGEWAAVRLVPPETPFRVQRVEAVLADGTFNVSICDASQKYLMRVYVVPAGSPPPDGGGVDPTTPYEFDFFAIREQEGDRTLSASISPPIVLQNGDTLVIAVDTHNSGAVARTCIKTCLEGDKNNRTYWSNARDPAAWKWTVYEPARGTGMWASAEGFGP